MKLEWANQKPTEENVEPMQIDAEEPPQRLLCGISLGTLFFPLLSFSLPLFLSLPPFFSFSPPFFFLPPPFSFFPPFFLSPSALLLSNFRLLARPKTEICRGVKS